jgi:hypothetical protein
VEQPPKLWPWSPNQDTGTHWDPLVHAPRGSQGVVLLSSKVWNGYHGGEDLVIGIACFTTPPPLTGDQTHTHTHTHTTPSLLPAPRSPVVIPPTVSAATHPHPSQGILTIDTSKVACLVYYLYGAAQAVALAAHAAGTPFDPRRPWLVSTMPAWAFLSSKLGLMPSKPANATHSMASSTPMQPGTVRTLRRQSWAILPSNVKMSGCQNPSQLCWRL